MKKQILASAVAAAFATGALAAEITLYGTVDTGFQYSYCDDSEDGNLSSYSMASGINSASRWGIKGIEELGNGYTVSFDLQSGFNSDDGTLGQDGRLFGREARLTVAGPFGELSFGRMGSLTSGAGTYDIFMGTADVFDGGWSTPGLAIGGTNFFSDVGRSDNMITYATPRFAGFKGYAQYSFKVDGVNKAKDFGTEGRNSAKRYLGVGMTYENGPFAGVMVYDMVLNGTEDTQAPKDGRAFSAGVSYDFGAAKVFAAYQYGRHQNAVGLMDFAYDTSEENGVESYDDDDVQVNSHNFHVGVSVPACSGTFNLGGYFSRIKAADDSNRKAKLFNVAATYVYPLSKRTSLYAGVGYVHYIDRIFDEDGYERQTSKAVEGAVGISHTF